MSEPRPPEPLPLLAVIPVVSHRWADRCVESILAPDSAAGLLREEILVVDNTRDATGGYGLRCHRDPAGHNLGVARSWNVGAREVLDRGLDYLVIVSASMLFGPVLHTAWTWQMREFWGAKVIEAEGHSFHLIAFHRSVFERVGLFDENFYPAYFEGEDFCLRLRMVGWEHGFVRVWVNALSQGHALHINDQTRPLACPAGPLLAYRRAKWGGDKGEETFVQPFGNKPLDYWPESTIPELAERYGLGAEGERWW